MSKRKTVKGIRYWKKKAWDEFSKFIRLRDALETTGTKTHLICCTCGKQYPAFGVGCAQAGHYVAGRNNAILFLEDCVHGQCYTCNKIKKGAPLEYRDFMDNKYGILRRLAIEKLRHRIVKLTVPELKEIRDEYKQKYLELLGD